MLAVVYKLDSKKKRRRKKKMLGWDLNEKDSQERRRCFGQYFKNPILDGRMSKR